jgi:hypothetical protein
MSTEPTSPQFSNVPERNSADVLLRTMQQHHVQLSVMADTKANILITVSSIILTLALSRLSDHDLQFAMTTLVVFVLIALFLAIIAVMPKYQPMNIGEGKELPSGFNLLFFGHFSELSRERFQQEISERLKTGGIVYETMTNDIYSIGTHLANRKYRFLRYSYMFFLAGFVCASLVQAAVMIWR